MARISTRALWLVLALAACTTEAPRSHIGEAKLAVAESVAGKLEVVTCDAITGWAHDTAAPDTPIAVEITFDAPISEKADGAFEAAIHRDDLCQALGSCAHAFDIAPPLSLFDDEPHAVYVYGDNAALTDRAPLDGGGAMMQCGTPVVAGSKRVLPSAAAMVSWRLNAFWHQVSLDDAAIEAIPDGMKLAEKPALVRADDGTPGIWLLDGSFRRAVSDSAFARWRFDSATIQPRAAAEIAAFDEGPPLRSRAMIVQSSLDQMFLIDEELPLTGEDPGTGGTGGTGKLPGGTVNDNRDSDKGSCAARVAPASPSGNGVAIAWLVALLALAFRGSRNACS